MRNVKGMNTSEEKSRPLEAALAKQIKIELAERDMTQAQLAEKMNVSRVSISKYLNGKTSFSYTQLIDLADIFGMDLSELVYRAESRLQQ